MLNTTTAGFMRLSLLSRSLMVLFVSHKFSCRFEICALRSEQVFSNCLRRSSRAATLFPDQPVYPMHDSSPISTLALSVLGQCKSLLVMLLPSAISLLVIYLGYIYIKLFYVTDVACQIYVQHLEDPRPIIAARMSPSPPPPVIYAPGWRS